MNRWNFTPLRMELLELLYVSGGGDLWLVFIVDRELIPVLG